MSESGRSVDEATGRTVGGVCPAGMAVEAVPERVPEGGVAEAVAAVVAPSCCPNRSESVV